MSQTNHAEYVREYESEAWSETPFAEIRGENYAAEELHESYAGVTQAETNGATWGHFETPFETPEASEAAVGAAPEVATVAELASELKDHAFREALEALASEALEAQGERLEGEFGDREQRDAHLERTLNEHFAPLAAELESSLDRLFERFGAYETGALSEAEIERLVDEVAPAHAIAAPASEQFLGGLLRKAGRLVSGAVNVVKSGVSGAINLAGKGLAAIGKLALGPLLSGLKKLGLFLLRHVVRFAMGQLPPALRPLAQQLSDRMFRALGETHDHELNELERVESEAVPAGADVARLEAEFDVAAAQLLFAPSENEAATVAEIYGEATEAAGGLGELDHARARLTRGLQELEAGESPQPVMEQLLPAMLWPVAKTAITMMGRPKLVSFIGNLLAGLIGPMLGAQAAGALAPAIADAGLRIFGLEAETVAAEPRAVVAEALTATVEETVNRLNELPASTFENELELEAAVREAFEDAAATYFPSTHIKPELRETHDRSGIWRRLPQGTHRKRYGKYSEPIPVTITPRVADGVGTFGHATLADHVRDRFDAPPGRPISTNVRVYQVLPGATTSSIARAERIHPRDLHPLTPHAAGALFGSSGAALGPRGALANPGLGTPHHLHLRQRLYYVEPPGGPHRARPHARLARTEVSINLRKGTLRVWLYLSEPLIQRVNAALAKPGGVAGAFRLVQPLVRRAAELVRSAPHGRRMAPAFRLVGEAPNFERHVPAWARVVDQQLAKKIDEWVSRQVAEYLRNNAERLRRLGDSEKDGVTLRITMTSVPGMEVLRQIARGQVPRGLETGSWLRGQPAFEVITAAGYAIA